jgi:DNA-binding MarR family transcriptional regulator
VWQALFDLFLRTAPARTASLARRGLTPNDARALYSLDRGTGRSMRSLADQWQCDPSNATLIVDRLENLGLAARQPLLHDKRVRLVVLTRKGEKTRTELLHEFHQPPEAFSRLDRADLEALGGIVAKLAAAPALFAESLPRARADGSARPDAHRRTTVRVRTTNRAR